MAIHRQITIDQIFEQFPEKSQKLAQEMSQAGLQCVGCGAATYETLEAGMYGHGFSDEQIDALIERLNTIIAEEIDPSTITLTERAAKKFQAVAEAEGKAGYGLRFADKPGGCSGFEYVLDFSPEPSPSDEVFHAYGVDIYVNSEALSRLLGCEIDYLDGLNGAGFKISNPNAKGACSCGNSQAY
ncbi:MAG: iron-sulfur cluster assembly accessory protein [Simkaniaceae bacterium]|nr:iron-sulfur cluster assembly accessory protein [Simkaniaceae bacterium]